MSTKSSVSGGSESGSAGQSKNSAGQKQDNKKKPEDDPKKKREEEKKRKIEEENRKKETEEQHCVNHHILDLPRGPLPGHPDWNPSPFKSRNSMETRGQRNNKPNKEGNDGCC